MLSWKEEAYPVLLAACFTFIVAFHFHLYLPSHSRYRWSARAPRSSGGGGILQCPRPPSPHLEQRNGQPPPFMLPLLHQPLLARLSEHQELLLWILEACPSTSHRMRGPSAFKDAAVAHLLAALGLRLATAAVAAAAAAAAAHLPLPAHGPLAAAPGEAAAAD